MLGTIINSIKSELEKVGATGVYSAFDNVPLEKRAGNIFTVVDICAFESTAPIYSLDTVYIPYTAAAAIRITAPESCTMTDIYTYYDKYISAAIAGASGNLSGMTVKFDSNIRRLVMTVKVSLSGIIKAERSNA